VPEECSPIVAGLYESCMLVDPRLRPSAPEVVASLEKEFCFGRSQSAPVPELEKAESLKPFPRNVVSLNPEDLCHPQGIDDISKTSVTFNAD
jgi:hypothetical protein